MSDVPELTPQEEREIIRLLAEAGGPVAAPPEVVARLDDVLAGLVTARATPEVDEVDEVAEARERRRRWPKVLLAAAAVVVGGYGLGAVGSLGPFGGSVEDRAVSGSAGSAGSERPTESEERSPAESLQERSRPPGLAEKNGTESSSGSAAPRGYTGALVRLQSERLETGVRRVLLRAEATDTSLSPFASAGGGRCGPPAGVSSDDSWFRVHLDGQRAVLVTEPRNAGVVDATVYSCDGGVLAETTVAAP